MTAYLLRRILFFVPTLLIITLLSFIISQSAPGDPVEQMLSGQQSGGEQIAERQANEAAYLQKRRDLGLDLPVFYFSIGPLAEPDTLYKIPKVPVQDALRRLVYKFGNWEAVQRYYQALLQLEEAFYARASDSAWKGTDRTEARALLVLLPQEKNYDEILHKLTLLERYLIPALRPAYEEVVSAAKALSTEATPWKIYVPTIHWYGTQNQYHRWLMGLFRGDFGISYQDKRPITSKLGDAVRWSIVINLISIVLAYLIAIPLGVQSAVRRGQWPDRVISTTLFMLYSLPTFWIGTMAIVFLCGGGYLDIFPPGGVQSTEHSPDWPFTKRLLDWIYHLILPVIVYTYGSLAFLSRQMRSALLEVLGQDYVRTARAKGLPAKLVIWKHAFRNSLIPIITLLASIFPGMISGSVILESIFSIPGMGFLSYGAMIARDYPVIIAVFTIGAILTLIGILVADILYAVVDPRISYSRR